MANQKRVADDGKFDLPEEIIHHIQSFMNERRAAHTTLLSKSWYRAWSTRPNLLFRDDEFHRMIEFPKFAIKTLQRYEDLNLKINTFGLSMQSYGQHSLATKLVIKAIKLGATDLTLGIRSFSGTLFVLPDEVLDSETLARLSVYSCIIDLRRRNKEVTCSNLKSLHFSNVTINGDLFWDLISRCASFEKLTLDTTTSFFGEKRRLSPFCDNIINLHKLKYLHLNGLDSKDTIYRHDLWPKFPCLKELVIWGYNSDYDWNNLRLCSRSLERITIHMYRNKITNGKFDVPNIRKFKFVGSELPHLHEFKTSTNRKWESDIQIVCDHFNASWCSSLNQFVKMLSPSRISLSICMNYGYAIDGYAGDGLPIPVVENLTILGYVVLSPAFLNALFWSCRPNFVSIDTRSMKEVNVKAAFQQLHYRPWKTFLGDSRNRQQFLHFQLN